MDKRTLRRELFARIRAIPAERRDARSAAICRSLAADPEFQTAGVVCGYLALSGEPDLSSLFCAVPGQRWAFPRVTEGAGLSFHELGRLSEAIPGGLGIREPDPSRHPEVDAGEPELILVPGVAFDPATRARLGRGRGHYDRFLAKALASARRPRLVGIAFSEQLAEVPAEAHDIPMDRLLTERGWL